MNISRVWLVLAFLFTVSILTSQSFDPKNVKISVLTCDPGAEVYSMYGHNALRVVDSSTQSDIVYNWGTFDFDEPGFLLKFMRGKLNYWLVGEEYGRFLQQYEYYNRSVYEQVLRLDSTQKAQVLLALSRNMQPENRTYKYDFFMDNCATRIRDIIGNNVANAQWAKPSDDKKTFRDIIKEFQVHMPWTDFGIDLIIGARADRIATPQEATFIPSYLASAFSNIKIGGSQSLASEQIEVLKYPVIMSGFLQQIWNPYVFFGLLLLLELWILMKGHVSNWVNRYDRLVLWLMVFVSVLMAIMWFLTDHVPTKDNWNLLWASPLWIYVALHFKQSRTKTSKIIYGIIAIGIFISMLNAFFQFLPQYFHPATAIIGAVLLLKLYRFKNRT